MTVLALFRLQLRRHRALFAAVLALAFLHEFVFLYIFQFWKDQAQLTDWIMSIIPGRVRQGMGIPLNDLTDPRTFKALVFMRPDSRALALLYGITLGTDVIAGEVGRGTADLLFSHPVRRSAAVLAGAAATFVHLVCLGATLLAAYALGSLVYPMGPRAPGVGELLPAMSVVVLGSFAICLLSFVVGSLCSNRTRAVGWTLLLVLVPFVLEVLGLFTSRFVWLARIFPEHYYRPHVVVVGLEPEALGRSLLALAIIGAVALTAAIVIAERRDLA